MPEYTYPGPREHLARAAEQLQVSPDPAGRLDPIQRLSRLVGQAAELRRDVTRDSGTFSDADRARAGSILVHARTEMQTLEVAAAAATSIYMECCVALGVNPDDPDGTAPPQPPRAKGGRKMAGERKPDELGRPIRPQETYGATPARPVLSDDPNVTGPAQQAKIPVAAPDDREAQEAAGAPGPATPAPEPARKDPETVAKGLMVTPPEAKEQPKEEPQPQAKDQPQARDQPKDQPADKSKGLFRK
jgi:hypothetical protein